MTTLLILLFFSFSTATLASDKSVMSAFLATLSPPPSTWTASTSYCTWTGVHCDTNNRATFVDLQSKQLAGSLPSNLNSVSQLGSLSFQNNHFPGELPSNLSTVTSLLRNSNNFSSVATSAFSGLISLLILSISDNSDLSPWLFPNELSESPNIVSIFTSNAKNVSLIPDTFSLRPGLTDLRLSSNGLNWSLPKSSRGLAVQDLWVDNQALSSSLEVLSGTSQLKQVSVHANQFSGPVPDLSSCTDLFDLHLSSKLEAPLLDFPKWLGKNKFCWNASGECDPQVLAFSLFTADLGYTVNLTEKLPGFRPEVTVNSYRKLPFRRSEPLSPGGGSGLGSDNTRKISSLKTDKILLEVLVLTLSVTILVIIVCTYKKKIHWGKHHKKADHLDSLLPLHKAVKSPIMFTHHALKTATNNFDMSRKLGGGGFGTVFEGSINDESEPRIAIKRLDHGGQGTKEFLAEVQTIGSIHHVNIVKLVGFCAENFHRLLLYEHMSNGSLDKWIFKTASDDKLSWNTKKKIILHIAKGLAYLHEGCQKRILHLDIKPQNVLLDEDFNAKLSDFGLAKLIDNDQSYVMTQIRGTRGYLAPEWLGRQITEKADVYSYGVVVLEIVFEKKNLDRSQHEESSLLIQRVKKKVETSQLSDFLLEACNEDMQHDSEQLEKTIKLAVWCLHTEPTKRPSMSTVIKVLEGATIPEVDSDDSLTVLNRSGNLSIEGTTHISCSVLSGPR